MTTIQRSSTEILNTNSSRTGDMNAQSARLKAAQAAVTEPSKYLSRAELDNSGLGKLFDNMQATFLNVKSQDTTARITGTRLTNEKRALKQFNDIMVRFKANQPGLSQAAGTMQSKVNRALDALEIAMRSKDTAGRYVWGGKDPGTDPLSRLDQNGNRVAVSLKNDSNLVNGLITNNFSSTAPNETVVTVSSAHDVRESFLSPGNEAIAKAIGYLNMLKANADAVDAGGPTIYTDQDLAATQADQEDARGQLSIVIDLEVRKVEEALTVNKQDIVDATKTNSDLFSANIVERTQTVKDLSVSLFALISLSGLDGKISDALANLRF